MRNFKIHKCPFCAGHPHVSMPVDYTQIFCGCGATGPKIRDTLSDVDRLEKAVEHWNSRFNFNDCDLYDKYVDYTYKEFGEK